jgi:LysM repeat protein
VAEAEVERRERREAAQCSHHLVRDIGQAEAERSGGAQRTKFIAESYCVSMLAPSLRSAVPCPVRLAGGKPSTRATSGRRSLAVKASYSPMDLSSGFSTRPYTVRKGDYLYAVARKRGISIEQIKALNPSLDVTTEDYLVPGMTILLPAGKLSERDNQILSGIGSGSKTRIYPVRKGETIQAIAANRGIPIEKLKQLNPAVDLEKLKGDEKLLLPGGYYTVREKEMLSTVRLVRELNEGTGGHLNLCWTQDGRACVYVGPPCKQPMQLSNRHTTQTLIDRRSVSAAFGTAGMLRRLTVCRGTARP